MLAASVILGALAGLHVFWAFGGRWGKAVAIPERDGAPLFGISRGGTLLVALGLVTAAAGAVVRGSLEQGPALRKAEDSSWLNGGHFS